jgi:hypothetical protein
VPSLVEVLDAIPDGERPAVIAAAQHPRVRVELRGAPLSHLVESADPYAVLLRRRIEILFTAPPVVIVASRTQRRNMGRDAGAEIRQVGMAIEAPLGDVKMTHYPNASTVRAFGTIWHTRTEFR